MELRAHLVTSLAMLGGLLYILYFAEGPSSPSSIPIIRAQCGPIRVKPENPGGRSVPHKDKLVYTCIQKEQPASPKQENFLEGPEEPLDLPAEKEIKSPIYTPPSPSSLSLKETPKLISRESSLGAPSVPGEKEKRKTSLSGEPSLKKDKAVSAGLTLNPKEVLKKRWYIQFSPFKTKGEAEKEKRYLTPLLNIFKGKFPLFIAKGERKGRQGPVYSLTLGPFSKVSEMKEVWQKLKNRRIYCTIKES